MSPEMNSLGRGERGKIDLYYNDMWALRCTMDVIKEESSHKMEPKLD